MLLGGLYYLNCSTHFLIIHIHSSIQTNTIHVITYFINFCFNGILQFHKDVAEQLVYVYFASANFVWYIRTNQFIANFLYIIADVYIHIAIDLLLSATTKELYG
jgi:hypothetical protein